jgi:hypothetical protein
VQTKHYTIITQAKHLARQPFWVFFYTSALALKAQAKAILHLAARQKTKRKSNTF